MLFGEFPDIFRKAISKSNCEELFPVPIQILLLYVWEDSTTYPTTTLCCSAASIDLFKNGNKQVNYFVGVSLFNGMET